MQFQALGGPVSRERLSWAVRAYPKLSHFNRLDKGGHFAAWEQRQAFTAELRAAFKLLRSEAVTATARG